jgi:hypothetical protein
MVDVATSRLLLYGGTDRAATTTTTVYYFDYSLLTGRDNWERLAQIQWEFVTIPVRGILEIYSLQHRLIGPVSSIFLIPLPDWPSAKCIPYITTARLVDCQIYSLYRHYLIGATISGLSGEKKSAVNVEKVIMRTTMSS